MTSAQIVGADFLQSGGLTVSNGLTILSSGIVVTGGVTVNTNGIMVYYVNCILQPYLYDMLSFVVRSSCRSKGE